MPAGRATPSREQAPGYILPAAGQPQARRLSAVVAKETGHLPTGPVPRWRRVGRALRYLKQKMSRIDEIQE
jgi:hypothetical protein